MDNNAIVLCSGGLDSVVLTHYLKKTKNINKIILLFIDYNQRSLKEELHCTKILAKELNLELKILDFKWLGDISTSIINKNNLDNEDQNKKDLISWYVPARNSQFLLAGLSIAESLLLSKKEIYNIYLGIKFEGDLSFKDTTPEFLEQINKLIPYSTQKPEFQFKAPFINKDKEELINIANELNINLKNTYTCYIGGGFNNKQQPIHCGKCAACNERKKAFRFSNNLDESIYLN